MNLRHALAVTAALATLTATSLTAQWPATEKLDLDAIYRIKEEGFQRSKVMEIESYLTDVYGPRLTGSPNIREAADWAQKTMRDWGLTNVHLETFPFGRGWDNKRFVANAITPRAYPLTGFPKAWTPGTNGPVTGEAVMAVIRTDEDFGKYKATLRGKFVLATPMRAVEPSVQPLFHRYSADELTDMSKQPRAGVPPPPGNAPANIQAQAEFNRLLNKF